MDVRDAAAALLILVGLAFFIAGTVGLLRLPDVFTRLHALTKADNLGLGFIVLGLAVSSDGWLEAAKLILVWLLALVSAATATHLIARAAASRAGAPWSRKAP